MTGSSEQTWDAFWRSVDALQTSVSKTTSVNINKDAVRSLARALVQDYFRTVRPHLAGLGLEETLLSALDEPTQTILRLAGGNNAKASYSKAIRSLRKARSPAEASRERLLGSPGRAVTREIVTSAVETRILETLKKLIPSAALSYEQALLDLRGDARVSYRGTAVELRETLREVLDHLAPDDAVMSGQGFKLEKDATKPTMKQKASFILKARGAASGALSAPRDAIQRVEDATASLARSAYTRGSLATHVATSKQEVQDMKPYVDAVLGELLQVHRGAQQGAAADAPQRAPS